MKFVIHIGFEKTGSTSIQKMLVQNTAVLESAGYAYITTPGLIGHRDLAAYCMRSKRTDMYLKSKLINTKVKRKKFQDRVKQDFELRVNALPESIKVVVISSEHFSSRLVHLDEVEHLRQLIDPFADEVKIIAYIRDQADKVIPQYSTAVKAGTTITFKDYLKSYVCCNQNDYDSLLENWEKVFGISSITLRIYDKAEFVEQGLLQGFLGCIDPTLVGRVDTDMHPQNTSLGRKGILFSRWVNRFLPIFIPGIGINRLNRSAHRYIRKHDKGNQMELNVAQRNQIENQFAAGNERIRERYFRDQRKLFSASTEPNR